MPRLLSNAPLPALGLVLVAVERLERACGGLWFSRQLRPTGRSENWNNKEGGTGTGPEKGVGEGRRIWEARETHSYLVALPVARARCFGRMRVPFFVLFGVRGSLESGDGGGMGKLRVW
jgi:hypothetical protein